MLRQHGHEVVTVGEVRLATASDDDVTAGRTNFRAHSSRWIGASASEGDGTSSADMCGYGATTRMQHGFSNYIWKP